MLCNEAGTGRRDWWVSGAEVTGRPTATPYGRRRWSSRPINVRRAGRRPAWCGSSSTQGSRQRVLEAKLRLDKERWLVPGMHVDVLLSPDRTRFEVDWDSVPAIEARVAANDPTLADPAGALREVAHALGYTQADTGTSRAEHFEAALQEAARRTPPPGKVRAVVVVVAMRGAMSGASGPDLIGSSAVSFQLRSAAVLSVHVPGRAPYAVYLRKFRFPRKSRTDYTGAGYPALVSASDPDDIEVLWDEVPSAESQLSDRLASSMALAESRQAALAEQWQAALGQAGAERCRAGGMAPEMRKLAADSARRALQYVQDPAMRKMLIDQYRAAGIEIPEDDETRASDGARAAARPAYDRREAPRCRKRGSTPSRKPGPPHAPSSPRPRAAPAAEAGHPSLLALQRSAGNAAVSRLVEGKQAGGDGSPADTGDGADLAVGRRLLVQRHSLDGEDNKDERDKLKQELIGLDGSDINGLLDGMAGADDHKRGHFRELTADSEVAGRTHEERLRVAIDAVTSKGTSVADFALAHKDDLEAIGHIDQIDAILKRVGKFDAKPLDQGDTLDTNLGKQGAVYREANVRIRKSDGLDVDGVEPGRDRRGVGVQAARRMPRQDRRARAHLGLPERRRGRGGTPPVDQVQRRQGAHRVQLLPLARAHRRRPRQALQEGARGRGSPPEKEKAMRAATKGNDPDRYVKTVAEAMGTTADAIQGKALSAVDAKAVARAIKEKGEGWIVGTEQSIDVAIANTSLPAQARFRLLYTKWSKKK